MNRQAFIVTCIILFTNSLQAAVVVTSLITQVDGAVNYSGSNQVMGNTSYSDSGWHRPLYQRSFSVSPIEIYNVKGFTNPIGNSSTTETLTFGTSSLSGLFTLSDQIYPTIPASPSMAYSHFYVNMSFTVLDSAVLTYSAAVDAINLDNGNFIFSGQTLGAGHYRFMQDYFNSDSIADQNAVTNNYSFNLQTAGTLTVVPETTSIVTCALGVAAFAFVRRR